MTQTKTPTLKHSDRIRQLAEKRKHILSIPAEQAMAAILDHPQPAALVHSFPEEDLHFLKGSALSLGFRQFSALCQAGETNALQGNASQIDLPEILSCYDRSKAKFIADLPGQLAA